MMHLNSNAHLNLFLLNHKDLESKTILPKIFCNMHIAIESILPLTDIPYFSEGFFVWDCGMLGGAAVKKIPHFLAYVGWYKRSHNGMEYSIVFWVEKNHNQHLSDIIKRKNCPITVTYSGALSRYSHGFYRLL